MDIKKYIEIFEKNCNMTVGKDNGINGKNKEPNKDSNLEMWKLYRSRNSKMNDFADFKLPEFQ